VSTGTDSLQAWSLGAQSGRSLCGLEVNREEPRLPSCAPRRQRRRARRISKTGWSAINGVIFDSETLLGVVARVIKLVVHHDGYFESLRDELTKEPPSDVFNHSKRGCITGQRPIPIWTRFGLLLLWGLLQCRRCSCFGRNLLEGFTLVDRC